MTFGTRLELNPGCGIRVPLSLRLDPLFYISYYVLNLFVVFIISIKKRILMKKRFFCKKILLEKEKKFNYVFNSYYIISFPRILFRHQFFFFKNDKSARWFFLSEHRT